MNGVGPDGLIELMRMRQKDKRVVWMQVKCTVCGWRGQAATFAINRYATITCPECYHTGKAKVPKPITSARAGVRQIKALWHEDTPPPGWRGPRWEESFARAEA